MCWDLNLLNGVTSGERLYSGAPVAPGNPVSQRAQRLFPVGHDRETGSDLLCRHLSAGIMRISSSWTRRPSVSRGWRRLNGRLNRRPLGHVTQRSSTPFIPWPTRTSPTCTPLSSGWSVSHATCGRLRDMIRSAVQRNEYPEGRLSSEAEPMLPLADAVRSASVSSRRRAGSPREGPYPKSMRSESASPPSSRRLGPSSSCTTAGGRTTAL